MKKTERLGNGICVTVTKTHTFGTDAILLASFASVKPNDLPIDLGTGCGVIPLLWCRQPRPEVIHCLDLQSAAVEQVQASIAHNQLTGRLFCHQWDLRELRGKVKPESFTVVTMNPPYKPLHTGIENLNESAKIARHEVTCTLADACEAAKYLLKYGGRFCMCHRPERLADVICALRAAGLEPKRLRFVADRQGMEPFLFLIEGRKGGKRGLRTEPFLILRQEDGRCTEEMKKIYGPYAEEHDK